MTEEEVIVGSENNVEGLAMARVKCRECSEGMMCDEPGLNYSQIFPQKGYTPMIHTTPETLAMMACINPACVGGPQRCEPGYTGIMCTDCEPAFKDGKMRKLGKKPGHACEVCLEPAVNAMRLAGVLTAVMLVICFFIRSTIKSAEVAKS